jgi:hypothetical protein
MKKSVILFAVFLFACTASQAQTSKGDQTLGVDFGFSYSKNNQTLLDPNTLTDLDVINGKTTSFNLSPTYSYFIANNVDIGASLNYQSSVTNNNNSDVNYIAKEAYKNYGASIFLRKYFMYQNKIGLRVGAYLDYSKQTNHDDFAPVNSTSDNDGYDNNYSGGLNLDLVYYPSKCLGFSATLANLSYQHSKANSGDQGNQDVDSFNFGYINNGLTLSVFYVFGGK